MLFDKRTRKLKKGDKCHLATDSFDHSLATRTSN